MVGSGPCGSRPNTFQYHQARRSLKLEPGLLHVAEARTRLVRLGLWARRMRDARALITSITLMPELTAVRRKMNTTPGHCTASDAGVLEMLSTCNNVIVLLPLWTPDGMVTFT